MTQQLSNRCEHQKVDKDGNAWDAYCIREKHEDNKHIHKSWQWWREKGLK